jgi:predicted RNA-binding Zn-ribbon protein involved in translation (DUF1610 family)
METVKAHRIDVAELKYLEIVCPDCGTSTILNLVDAKQNMVPTKCSGCPKVFWDDTKRVLNERSPIEMYWHFYRAAVKWDVPLRFHVPKPTKKIELPAQTVEEVQSK